MLDEQAEQIFATTDDIAEWARKIGGTTLRLIGHVIQQDVGFEKRWPEMLGALLKT